ncbi:MAG: nuclear transport factor 2 family protein [Bacteroidetes bacterium]|nr:nuclear transport factor 2 family protein [Bacteroidota bacterium]
MTLYADNACLMLINSPSLHGKENIYGYWENEMAQGHKVVELNCETVHSAGNIAIERGNWLVKLNSGDYIKGKYLTEWHLIKGKWLMVNDIGAPE